MVAVETPAVELSEVVVAAARAAEAGVAAAVAGVEAKGAAALEGADLAVADWD